MPRAADRYLTMRNLPSSVQTTHDLTVNGAPASMPASARLVDLLASKGVDANEARGVAVAINGRIVRKTDWAEQHLSPGDDVEIVTARQGG